MIFILFFYIKNNYYYYLLFINMYKRIYNELKNTEIKGLCLNDIKIKIKI